MYRMLDPALYGFVHIDQVSKSVTSPYIRIPKMSALYHISPRRSSYFLRPRHQNIQICKTDGVKPQLLAATLNNCAVLRCVFWASPTKRTTPE